MEKADRDPNNTLRAEVECRDLLTKYPNSKFALGTEQRLRDIQEALAQSEMVAGVYYFNKVRWPPRANNRLTGLVGQYPLYSRWPDPLARRQCLHALGAVREGRKRGCIHPPGA